MPAIPCPAWGIGEYQVAVERGAARFAFDHLIVSFVMNDVPPIPFAIPVEFHEVSESAITRYWWLRSIRRQSALATLVHWRP